MRTPCKYRHFWAAKRGRVVPFLVGVAAGQAEVAVRKDFCVFWGFRPHPHFCVAHPSTPVHHWEGAPCRVQRDRADELFEAFRPGTTIPIEEFNLEGPVPPSAPAVALRRRARITPPRLPSASAHTRGRRWPPSALRPHARDGRRSAGRDPSRSRIRARRRPGSTAPPR